jgi:hypothetical protein
MIPFNLKIQHLEGGANEVSLKQAQENYEKFGACEKEMIGKVIRPGNLYKRNPNWKIL